VETARNVGIKDKKEGRRGEEKSLNKPSFCGLSEDSIGKKKKEKR